MHPYVSVQYNLDKLGRFLIAKAASDNGQGEKLLDNKISYNIDSTKTRLKVPCFNCRKKI